MANIEELLSKLSNGAETTIDLYDEDNNAHRLIAAFIPGITPKFQLAFTANALEGIAPVVGINCQLTVKGPEGNMSIIAELVHIDNERRLSFIAREPISPEALREYFRVSVQMPIEIGYTPGPKEVKTKSWELVGSTVDISASGALALFSDKPQSTKNINIELFPPDTDKSILCTGHIVRTYRLRKKRYQIAIHFENVDQIVRDQLISCCLQEQRRQLRDNVRLKDT